MRSCLKIAGPPSSLLITRKQNRNKGEKTTRPQHAIKTSAARLKILSDRVIPSCMHWYSITISKKSSKCTKLSSNKVVYCENDYLHIYYMLNTQQTKTSESSHCNHLTVNGRTRLFSGKQSVTYLSKAHKHLNQPHIGMPDG